MVDHVGQAAGSDSWTIMGQVDELHYWLMGTSTCTFLHCKFLRWILSCKADITDRFIVPTFSGAHIKP